MMKNQQKQQTTDTETQACKAFSYGTDLSGRVWRWAGCRLWMGTWPGIAWEWKMVSVWEGMRPGADWVGCGSGAGRDRSFTYPVPRRHGHTSPEVVQNRQAHPEECPAPTCYRKGHIINLDSGCIPS